MRPRSKWPEWASPVSLDDMKRLVAESRRLMPDVGVQVPPNLSDWWVDLVEAGATDLGGLSANGDHISPEHPFPSPHQVRKRLRPGGFALTERLCVYPQYMDPEWIDPAVLGVLEETFPTFLPRNRRANGAGRRVAVNGDLAGRAIVKGREGAVLDPDELAALFAEARPEVIEDLRQAADELRAEIAGDVATFVVNRNINFTNVCTVGCAFCGFGQTRRSPDAYHLEEDVFAERIREAVEVGATEICMQGGIHPDYTLEHYGRWLALAKETAPDIHLHAYSPMEVHFMCERSGREPDYVFAYLREQGLGSTPGTAAEVLEDGVRQRISPNKLPAGPLGRDHRGFTPRRPALDLDGHVRPHRDAPGAGRAHARHPRTAGADRRDHRVRPALLHPLPHDARPHPRHRGDLRRGEPQAHGRLPPRARALDHQPPGELGEDGPRRRHRGAPLGRQRPRRHADGGEHLAHGRLPARQPPGARGPDRGRQGSGPDPGAAKHALRGARDATSGRGPRRGLAGAPCAPGPSSSRHQPFARPRTSTTGTPEALFRARSAAAAS